MLDPVGLWVRLGLRDFSSPAFFLALIISAFLLIHVDVSESISEVKTIVTEDKLEFQMKVVI